MERIMQHFETQWTEKRTGSRSAEVRLIRLKLVITKCGKSRSSIYEGMKNATFPKAVKLGPRASAWVEGEINDWLHQRIRASRRHELDA